MKLGQTRLGIHQRNRHANGSGDVLVLDDKSVFFADHRDIQEQVGRQREKEKRASEERMRRFDALPQRLRDLVNEFGLNHVMNNLKKFE